MISKKTFLLIRQFLIYLILGIPLLGIASIEYNCYYDSEGLQFEVKDSWDLLRIKGLGVREEEGKPIVPADYIHLLIPEGQEALSLHVRINSSYTLTGRYRIKPSLLEKETHTMDSTIYQSERPYPGIRAEIVGTGSFAGNRIVDIRVYPMDYYPQSGKIVLFTDLTVELFYEPSGKVSVKQLYRAPYSEYIIQKALTGIVDNDHDIPFYSYRPYIRSKSPDSYSCSYIVITADSLMDVFQPLIHWITKKGIKAKVISVKSILQLYSYDPVSQIYDSAGGIRGFLMDAYGKGTQWVLLGGDEEIVPVRYGTSENNDSTVPEQPPSDLYYSDLDGNWNVDGDDLYGEPVDDAVDDYPELFVGRLPCNNTKEIENWIEKVLSYEKNPGNGNTDYLRRIFWTGADEHRDEPGYIIENGSYPPYFEHDTTMLEDASGSYPRGSEVVDQMNNHYGWFNLYGHGAPDQLTVSAPGYNNWSEERDFLVSLDSCEVYHYNLHGGCRIETGNGLDSLNNRDYYGIMYLASCYQCAYDQEHFGLFDTYCGPCMGEAFTILPERGGPAFLGYTRYAKEIPSLVLHLRFLDALFDDSLMNIGVTEAISRTKVYPHFIHLSHTLFGCPLMPVWTDIPSYLNVAFLDSIPPEPTDFEAEITSSGNPVKDAYICLWKDNEVYECGFSGVNGTLVLSIEPETEGEMLLTVTKENFIPFEGTVHIFNNTSAEEDETASLPLCRIKDNLSHGKVLFEFYLPSSGKVELDIFNLTGRRLIKLIDRRLKKGTHQFKWNAEGVERSYIPNGIYFYNLHYKNHSLKGKFLLLQ